MRFSDLARQKLLESKDRFGSYNYYDKGADEVMDVGELVKVLKKLPVDQARTELVLLATRQDCPLDPTKLVSSILHDLDDLPAYESLFEDEQLSQYY